MSPKSLDEHIVITPGTAGGRPRIAGRRIAVQNIAFWHEQQGMSVGEIAEEFDLTLSDIHAALAYYFDHREEIDARAKEDDEFVEEMRKQHPSMVQAKLAERGLDARND
jgi:uncharacterized protein (DUF433 family)